jgi:hypothetical protein
MPDCDSYSWICRKQIRGDEMFWFVPDDDILQRALAWRRLVVRGMYIVGSGKDQGECMVAWWTCPVVAGLYLCVSLAHAANPTAGGDAIVNPVELQSFDQLSATRDRPLFSPTRQPPPKPVAAAVVSHPEPPPPPPPSVVVLGIVSEDGDGRAAIRSGDKHSGDKVERVRIGDDVGGWKVDRIEPRRLVLMQGERSVDFSLFGGAAKAAKSSDATAPERRTRQVH